MLPLESTQLTDDQISELVSARRKSLRLRAMRRLSSALRDAVQNRAGLSPDSAPLALPGPSSPLLPGPLFERLTDPSPEGRLDVEGRASRPTPPGPKPGGVTELPGIRLQPLPRVVGARGAARLATALRRLPWTVIRERSLLLVETCALVGLLVIVTGSFSGIGGIGVDTAGATHLVDPTPTTITPEEQLPGSSAPPSAGAEMPLPLRPLVRGGVATQVPIPTPGPQAATRIVIPAIEVDSAVVEGDSWELLKKGVGHHLGTANPGERGNAVYAGHNDVYGEIFRRLEELKPGDAVTLYAGQRQFHYLVRRVRIVDPKETSVMATTPDATLTLITCHPYRIDTHRLIVIATLTE